MNRRETEAVGSREVSPQCFYSDHSQCLGTVTREMAREIIDMPCECECHAPLMRP